MILIHKRLVWLLTLFHRLYLFRQVNYVNHGVLQTKLLKLLGNDFKTHLIDPELPEIKPVSQSKDWLEQHPEIRMLQAKLESNETSIRLARQGYKPSWMLDITYGNRQDAENGAKRADFVSAMISFDLPLFTGERQDKMVA